MSQTTKDFAANTSAHLLKIGAIKLNPEHPFTWKSGWKSPIYCDNRKTLGDHDVRTYIKDALVYTIKQEFPQVTVIAGVATGAISQGTLIADALKKPFCYVRSAPKDHGLGNLIEGYQPGKHDKVIVVEDLISTGGSSLDVVSAIRATGAEVVGMVAIFSYRFPTALEAFTAAEVPLITLTDYSTTIGLAVDAGYVPKEFLPTLRQWRESPDTWGK